MNIVEAVIVYKEEYIYFTIPIMDIDIENCKTHVSNGRLPQYTRYEPPNLILSNMNITDEISKFFIKMSQTLDDGKIPHKRDIVFDIYMYSDFDFKNNRINAHYFTNCLVSSYNINNNEDDILADFDLRSDYHRGETFLDLNVSNEFTRIYKKYKRLKNLDYFLNNI